MKESFQNLWSSVLALLLSFLVSSSLQGEVVKLRNLVQIQGLTPNDLLGYGLVAGLKASGDSNKVLSSQQTVVNLFHRLGLDLDPRSVVAGSYAAVMVTAKLPAFTKPGDLIDVRISSIGDAKSLQGGTLLSTMLKAGDGQIYALAQGPVVTGQALQTPTVARIVGGGSVERGVSSQILEEGSVGLSIKNPTFSLHHDIVVGINGFFRGFYAISENPSSIKVKIPGRFQGDLMGFLSKLEMIDITTQSQSRIVINERTGTVVLGHDIAVSPVSIAHGDLSIVIAADKGKDVHKNILSVPQITISGLLEALNELGVKPKDLMDILHALHVAGAIHAELEFM